MRVPLLYVLNVLGEVMFFEAWISVFCKLDEALPILFRYFDDLRIFGFLAKPIHAEENWDITNVECALSCSRSKRGDEVEAIPITRAMVFF